MLLRIGGGEALADGEAVAVGLERLVELALRHQHVADLVVRAPTDRAATAVAAVGGGEALGDGEAVAVGLERLVELALLHQHVADLVVGHRQVALPLRVAAIGGGEALGDGEAVAVGLERLLQVPERQVGFAELVRASPHGFVAASRSSGADAASCSKVALAVSRILRTDFGAHALHVAQPLGNIENEALGGLLRQLEVARGPVALLLGPRLVLLRDAALLDRHAPLPIGKSGKTERQHQPGGETAGEDVSPPGRRLAGSG